MLSGVSVERIGTARSRRTGAAVMFHRVRVKSSRKYRVWPVAGDKRYFDLDPSEWMLRYETIVEYTPQSPRRLTNAQLQPRDSGRQRDSRH